MTRRRLIETWRELLGGRFEDYFEFATTCQVAKLGMTFFQMPRTPGT